MGKTAGYPRKTRAESPPLPLKGLQFAVYARKSSEDDRNEDHRSTGRQVEQATAWVQKQGGHVLPGQVYVDDAVSGAEFKSRRDLLRFLDALKNGKPFNAVVMSEQSRLGREQLETGYLLKQIRDAQVRVFYYLTGEEAKLDSALDKIMSSLTSFAAEMEREKARQRARDTAERKARQGYVTGGEPYGYENVHMQGGREVPRGQPHDFARRRMKADEAEVVRAIFKMYAAGWGMTRIAKAMNGVPAYAEQNREYFGGKRVPPPRNRTGSWAPAAIREILYRRLYHGEIVWGKSTHIDRDGRAGVAVRRDERDWLVRPAPELQIVDDDLWAAVQARLRVANENYLRDCRGKLWGKPDIRNEGRYLLTGLARCGVCGWNMAVLGGVRRVYGCSHSFKRGVCSNDLTQRVDLVDSAFLAALGKEVLVPERFRYALTCGIERIKEELEQAPDRRPTLERERATLVRKVERMVAAIGDGRGPAALVQEIAKAEARIKEIDQELGRLAAAPALERLDVSEFEEGIADQLSRFSDLLRGNVPRARQALKKLLADRVEFAPAVLENGDRTYAFKGELSYGAVLREAIYLRGVPSGIRTRVLGLKGRRPRPD